MTQGVGIRSSGVIGGKGGTYKGGGGPREKEKEEVNKGKKKSTQPIKKTKNGWKG